LVAVDDDFVDGDFVDVDEEVDGPAVLDEAAAVVAVVAAAPAEVVAAVATALMADMAAGAAKTAVKPTSAVALAAPTMTRARWAGWGRRRRPADALLAGAALALGSVAAAVLGCSM
jgi:hypothetical protein